MVSDLFSGELLSLRPQHRLTCHCATINLAFSSFHDDHHLFRRPLCCTWLSLCDGQRSLPPCLLPRMVGSDIQEFLCGVGALAP